MFITLLAILAMQDADPVEASPVTAFEVQGFRSQLVVQIAAPRDEVWDAATGDVSGWWDHRHTQNPVEYIIEPKFGGRFYERFEEGSLDGAVHASIPYVDTPERLIMHGPLGLIGRSYDLVTTWSLAERNDGASTTFTVDLSMHGEIDEELASIVHGVWVHFIEERLKVYVEAGCHQTPDEPCEAFEN